MIITRIMVFKLAAAQVGTLFLDQSRYVDLAFLNVIHSLSLFWGMEEQRMVISKRRLGFAAIIGFALVLPVRAWSQAAPNPKLIEAAKKEGELVYYTTMTLDQSKAVVDRFEKKFGIRAQLFRTGGGPLLNKITTEARGGRYDWDIVV